ncbi:cytoplasm protein [Phlyctochytrium arcticum]|nr:cytoplasm protein [Phlyctochytrium arcticum]
MFLLKNLGSLVFGSEGGGSRLVELPSGLLLSDTLTTTTPYSCAIERATNPFTYTLSLRPVQASDSDHHDYQFNITESMAFHRHSDTDKGVQFTWMNDKKQQWTYNVADTVGAAILAMFEDTVYTCMLEHAIQRSHSEMSDAYLTAYVDKMKAAVTKSPATTTKAPERKVKEPTGTVKVAVPAHLYIYDIRVGHFVLLSPSTTISISESSSFTYSLSVSDATKLWLSQPINGLLAPTFNSAQRSFVWVEHDLQERPVYTWSVRFVEVTEAEETRFRACLTECVYQHLNRENFLKIKQDDRAYLEDLFEDMDISTDSEEEEEEEEEEEKTEKNDEHKKDETADTDDEEEAFESNDKGNHNSQLAVGYKHDRSFVVRGNRIGVFKHTDNDTLEFSTTINNLKTMEGVPFSPRKVMLHDQDSTLVLMKPDDKKNLLKMDLEYGKIVEEWRVDENRDVEEIVPDAKYAQLSTNKTFVGIGHNSIFRIDPRLSGSKLVESESKQYASNRTDFTCATTTGKGELAVGSSKGEIRLFNKLNTRAKTHLPGLGDPIIGIDTTENGRWIIATCKSHLLLIDCFANGSENGTSGFTKSLGSEKPQPKRLQLKPEHIAWLGTAVSFTPARFSTGDSEEGAIITSTGPHVIRWNFRRVKAGKLYDYTIKTYADTVVADNFKYGQDRAMIVTLPENVEMVTKKNLSTPAKLLKSRNSIVNSPY